MKPIKILLFTIFVFLLLAGAMWLTPDNGVKVASFTFHMPTFGEMFGNDKVVYTDVSEIIDKQFDIDSLDQMAKEAILEHDSAAEEVVRASYDSLVQTIYKIELTDEARQNLSRFFLHLDSAKLTRIMHYGDSQLEGDRITAFLRNRLQTKFGGTGPGLRPVVQPYDYLFSAVQENSPNWTRYPLYGNIDSTVQHNRYGVMEAFARFAPLTYDTIPFVESALYVAYFSIQKSNIAFLNAQQYKHMRLFYGNSKRPVEMQVFVHDTVYISDTLKANVDYAVYEATLPDSTDEISFRFYGSDSPDFYGIELADTVGIIMDNIALRGSSGTVFTKNDFEHSVKMYRDLDPSLIILQFGGNVIPYIKDQEAIDRYGRWFTSQLNRLKLSCPDAAFIVIGPSDMSTKIKDKYVTYDHLPMVVDVLRNAAFSTGCGFWDMYNAMGGYNSMPSWVNAEPELARPDYVHFSTKGARLISNMFYNALLLEYNNYTEATK